MANKGVSRLWSKHNVLIKIWSKILVRLPVRLWSKKGVWIYNVPMEIWWEILARLPVRSLVRFRCVSRSWKTVIDDPDFCRDHLELFKNNYEETHLLMVQGPQGWQEVQHCLVRCSDTIKGSRRLGHLGSRDKKTGEFKSTATSGFSGLWRIQFSVDGLVMLKCNLQDRLMLWNPSIRRCRLVQESQESQDTGFLELGLGFDPLIKDYKLVRVEIYTIGTASWKTVTAQGALPSSWLQTVAHHSFFFKGCLYILSSTKLISFDLTREVFKSVDLPEFQKSVFWFLPDYNYLVEMWSSLVLLHFSSKGGSVWVLDYDNVAAPSSWSMRSTFSMRVPRFLYLKKNSDLLFNGFKFCMESYNIYSEEEKPVTNFREVIRVLGYKESLVLLK